MNRLLLALFLALSLTVACHGDGDRDSVFGSSTPIIGSGVVVSEYRSVSQFDSVDLQAFAAVTITQGGAPSVRIEADDNIIDHIRTWVSGGVLIIDSDSSYDTLNGVKLYLAASAVRSLQLSGVGSITVTNIDSSGTVQVTQTGVGAITVSGAADALAATLAGTGRIEAQGLSTRRSTVLLSGQGDCRVTATEELDVTISGLGDVYYAGNPPTVRSSITGRGRLIPI